MSANLSDLMQSFEHTLGIQNTWNEGKASHKEMLAKMQQEHDYLSLKEIIKQEQGSNNRAVQEFLKEYHENKKNPDNYQLLPKDLKVVLDKADLVRQAKDNGRSLALQYIVNGISSLAEKVSNTFKSSSEEIVAKGEEVSNQLVEAASNTSEVVYGAAKQVSKFGNDVNKKVNEGINDINDAFRKTQVNSTNSQLKDAPFDLDAAMKEFNELTKEEAEAVDTKPTKSVTFSDNLESSTDNKQKGDEQKPKGDKVIKSILKKESAVFKEQTVNDASSKPTDIKDVNNDGPGMTI